jgi:hypothetical protein
MTFLTVLLAAAFLSTEYTGAATSGLTTGPKCYTLPTSTRGQP